MPSEDLYKITSKGSQQLREGWKYQESLTPADEPVFQGDVDGGILKTLVEFGPSDYQSLVLENIGGIKWRDPDTGRLLARIVGEGDVRSSIRRLYEHGLIEKVE